MFRAHRLLMALAIIFGVVASTPLRAADLGGYIPNACGLRIYNGLPVSFGYGLCYQRELVPTPWGPRWRLVNRCC